MERAKRDRVLAEIRQVREREGANGDGAEVDSDAANGDAEWFTKLLSLSPDSFAVLEPSGKILYLSRCVPGRTISEFLGKGVGEFLPAEHAPAYAGALAALLATGEPQHVVFESQSRYWWDSRLAPIKNASGAVEYIVMLGIDITERKRAEQSLALAQGHLELALEASGMGQWRWDLANDAVTWDAATRGLHLWESAAEPNLETWIETIHPADRGRVRIHLAESVATKSFADLEYRVAIPGNGERSVLSKGKVFENSKGEPIAVIGAALDITAQKRRDAGAERARKLEAIGQLAGGIAHDFNNLLVVINGSIELAIKQADGAKREALLSDALAASERAAALTRQLLTFGSRQSMAEETLDLNEIIRDTLVLLERLLPESIELDFVEGRHLSKFVGDRGQVEQVLVNLCVNSRDAMPSGGRLTLESEMVVINGKFRDTHPWASPGRYLLLTVTDTGIGMSEEALERIFEPFFTTKAHGTGLGLATVFGIVKQHAGLVHVYSERGLGTTFKVYLPATERTAETVGTKLAGPVVGGRETILLAEDEPAVRSIVERLLKSSGYTVIAAADGLEAVEQFRLADGAISLVILDAIMPRMGGEQALEEIRKMSAVVPIVISSGYANGFSARPERRLRFLQKPYDPDALLRTVRSAIDAR